MISKNNSFKDITEKIKFYISNFTVNIKKIIKKNKLIVISLFSFIIFMLVSMFFLINLNQDKIIDKLNEALLNENKVRISKFVMVNEKKVSEQELEPLINYYNENQEKIKNLINGLRTEGRYGTFKIIVKKNMFYKRYYININTVEIEFTSNLNNIEVEFGNKKFKLMNEAKFDVIPGIYELKYTHKTEYGDITEKVNLSIVENKKINLDVNGNYITLYSNFNDAEVFINDKYTGLSAKDIVNFGPIPRDKEILIKLKKEFPWGKIESEEVDISNKEYLKLDINMANDNLINMINQDISKFYNSVFEALNKKNKDEILNCTEEVKDTIYSYINENSILFSNNYEINNINVEIEKSDFKYEDYIYKASILTKASYNISKNLLPFLETKYENYFLLNLEYVENGFKVIRIQKINID
ncbi:MAG: hypothetical protein KHZ55_05175 [Clostridium celatum]|nr:hypothetical protein [Clostridium celatum]